MKEIAIKSIGLVILAAASYAVVLGINYNHDRPFFENALISLAGFVCGLLFMGLVALAIWLIDR